MYRLLDLILIILFTLSCDVDRNKVQLFNSKLSLDQALVIDKLSQEMDNWFYEYSGGLDYNGKQMKALLLEFSDYNNIGSIVRKAIICEDNFLESEIDILFDIGFISLQIPTDYGTSHRGLLNKSNWLGKAICEYAIEEQDILLENWCNNENDVVYLSGMICLDYGSMTSQQLEDPVIKRMLYMELILPEMLEHCYAEEFEKPKSNTENAIEEESPITISSNEYQLENKEEELSNNCFFRQPDTSVIGICIWNPRSTENVLGEDITMSGDGTYGFISKDGLQYINLTVHPASYLNQISIFEVGYVQDNGSEVDFKHKEHL